MKSSQSIFNLRSPSFYLARSYLIATVLQTPDFPPDVYLISEKSILKNQVRRNVLQNFYFKLDFYCLHSLQKSILKFMKTIYLILFQLSFWVNNGQGECFEYQKLFKILIMSRFYGMYTAMLKTG